MGTSKGPLYSAIGRFLNDMGSKVKALNEVQAKLDEAGLKLDSLNQGIKEAEGSLAPLEGKKNSLDKQIEALEAKLTEKSELVTHLVELEKLGFDIARLSQLKNALAEIGAKHGLKGKEAVGKFFHDLKDYEAVLGAEQLLEGLQTKIETKKLEAGNWQAKEEALRIKHDDLKEAIGAVSALRAKGIKVGQIVIWHQILNQIESVEQFEKTLTQYGGVTKLLNARKAEAEAYELKLAKAKSQVEALEKDRAKIEAAIDALKVAGIKEIEEMSQALEKDGAKIEATIDALKVAGIKEIEEMNQALEKDGAKIGAAIDALKVVGIKELKVMSEAVEKDLKAVTASEIGAIQAVGQEAGNQLNSYFAQIDQLLEKVFKAGQEFEKRRPDLEKYEGVKDALQSHSTEWKAQK